MDLFQHQAKRLAEREAPLAARMRPRSLDEFVGQDHILGPGRLLRRAIAADQLSSLIFYGPPGTGKTTLAQIIANTTQAWFIALNAVLAGVKDIREAIETAQQRRGQFGQRTILFVDEVHRFNKAQQDALLPWVENGTVTLIGATTENPYFEVNKALVSRSRLFQLLTLDEAALAQILERTLQDLERGYGDRPIHLRPEAREHLLNVANGDARALLNALELAVETTPPAADGTIDITLTVAEESIQRRAVLYDREGDAHFDTISAFIKSLRGSDPDAALYWLARMVYGGEDPRYLFRRILIAASEDVGLADPQAVRVVEACAASFDRIGLPEGLYPLAQAALYLASAPKSNSVLGFFDALKAVEQEQTAEVPTPLKDASRDRQGLGHGSGYRYPHAYTEHWVPQAYLPDSLKGRVFYRPGNQGQERDFAAQLQQRREAQLAAWHDAEAELPLVHTASPADRQLERWLARTLSGTSEHLAQLRERCFTNWAIARHDRVLVLNAGSGLLLWEALRRTPEGGVVGLTRTPQEAQSLQEQSQALGVLSQPQLVDEASDWAEQLQAQHWQFEWLMGRNALEQPQQATALLTLALPLLTPSGRVRFLEDWPGGRQRLYEWLVGTLPPALWEQVRAVEEAYYARQPNLYWSPQALIDPSPLAFSLKQETLQRSLVLTPHLVQRWMGDNGSYRQILAEQLTPADLQAVEEAFRQLQGRSLPQTSVLLWLEASV
jgi:putative ATPase